MPTSPLRRIRFSFALAALALLCFCGCEDLSPGVEPIADAPEADESQPAPDVGSSALPQSPGNGGGSPTSSSQPTDRVQLRTGVALPQTLPSGTCMTFSVEYEFQLGPPDSNCKYFLVFESGKGQAYRHPAQVRQSGTIQAIASSLRPDDGPFSCHMVEETQSGQPQRISPSLSLR